MKTKNLIIIPLALLVSLIISSCRSWPDNPQQVITQVQGFYIGVGNLEGGLTNVLIEILTADSLGNLKGSIIYRSDTTQFSQIRANTGLDSVWFVFLKDTTIYHAYAVVSGLGLSVNFTAPTGIPVFRVNKEVNGYNMTGMWNGQMTSTYSINSHDAQMNMTQESALFSGSVNVTFQQAVTFELSSGAVNGADFQLSGTMGSTANGISALFYGRYESSDRISGYWSAGPNGVNDNGEFVFVRTF
jgi:hypothetical protein